MLNEFRTIRAIDRHLYTPDLWRWAGKKERRLCALCKAPLSRYNRMRICFAHRKERFAWGR